MHLLPSSFLLLLSELSPATQTSSYQLLQLHGDTLSQGGPPARTTADQPLHRAGSTRLPFTMALFSLPHSTCRPASFSALQLHGCTDTLPPLLPHKPAPPHTLHRDHCLTPCCQHPSCLSCAFDALQASTGLGLSCRRAPGAVSAHHSLQRDGRLSAHESTVRLLLCPSPALHVLHSNRGVRLSGVPLPGGVASGHPLHHDRGLELLQRPLVLATANRDMPRQPPTDQLLHQNCCIMLAFSRAPRLPPAFNALHTHRGVVLLLQRTANNPAPRRALQLHDWQPPAWGLRRLKGE